MYKVTPITKVYHSVNSLNKDRTSHNVGIKTKKANKVSFKEILKEQTKSFDKNG